MKFGFENEDLMGKRIVEIPYRQLVELGAVLDYEVLVLKVSHNDIKQFIAANTWVRDFDFMDNEEFQSRFIASLIAMDKAIKKGYSKRILSFHSRVSHAQNAEKAIRSLKDSKVFSSFNKFDFTGTCKGSQASINKKKLQYLANAAYAYLTNARVLTEGISVNEIDTVLFFDPKTSAADVQQAFSRAIRLLAGKELARIIIPVIVDDENNIDAPQFQHMINILDFLGEQDSVLNEELTFASQSNRVRRNSSRIINTEELEIEGFNIEEFYAELDLAMYTRYKAKNGYWTKERLIEYVSTRTTRSELLHEFGALNALEANDYALWIELASHIPLPNKGLNEEECAKICAEFTGTYTEFFKDYHNVIMRFYAIANLESNDYTSGSELIIKYCSHMPKGRIDYKNSTSQDLINMIADCGDKKAVRLSMKTSFVMALKKWEHLAEAFEYYNQLPSIPTGLKLGQRRGGGWKLN